MTGGTLPKFIERLTHDKFVDADFLYEFLYRYSYTLLPVASLSHPYRLPYSQCSHLCFLSNQDFVSLMRAHYEDPKLPDPARVALVRRRVGMFCSTSLHPFIDLHKQNGD